MLNWIKFRREQHKIERWMDKISRAHKDAEKNVRERCIERRAVPTRARVLLEHLLADDEMIRLTDSHYVRLANRMLIPVPEFKTEGGAWMESEQTGLYHLTPQAVHELRATIGRKESPARGVDHLACPNDWRHWCSQWSHRNHQKMRRNHTIDSITWKAPLALACDQFVASANTIILFLIGEKFKEFAGAGFGLHSRPRSQRSMTHHLDG